MRYIYFGKENIGKKHGVICVGYKFEGERGLKLSFCFCSPLDIFSKKKAHAIIEGRMEKGNSITVNTEGPEKLKYEEIANIAKDVLNDAMPYGVPNVRAYVESVEHKSTPEVGNVKLPWWFTGI